VPLIYTLFNKLLIKMIDWYHTFLISSWNFRLVGPWAGYRVFKKKKIYPLQIKSKSESKKVDIFGSKLRPNTFTFVDHFLLIFCNGGSM
jgi:hypothetical protein